MFLSKKHHRWIKFGPKHHPLHHEKQGSEHGQVVHKGTRWECNGKLVAAPRSRKNPAKVGM